MVVVADATTSWNSSATDFPMAFKYKPGNKDGWSALLTRIGVFQTQLNAAPTCPIRMENDAAHKILSGKSCCSEVSSHLRGNETLNSPSSGI